MVHWGLSFSHNHLHQQQNSLNCLNYHNSLTNFFEKKYYCRTASWFDIYIWKETFKDYINSILSKSEKEWIRLELWIIWLLSRFYPQAKIHNLIFLFNETSTITMRGGGQMAHSKSKWLFLCNRMSDWPQTKLYFQVCPLSWGL